MRRIIDAVIIGVFIAVISAMFIGFGALLWNNYLSDQEKDRPVARDIEAAVEDAKAELLATQQVFVAELQALAERVDDFEEYDMPTEAVLYSAAPEEVVNVDDDWGLEEIIVTQEPPPQMYEQRILDRVQMNKGQIQQQVQQRPAP